MDRCEQRDWGCGGEAWSRESPEAAVQTRRHTGDRIGAEVVERDEMDRQGRFSQLNNKTV